MLIISMASSLSLWIALPWGFLGWSPDAGDLRLDAAPGRPRRRRHDPAGQSGGAAAQHGGPLRPPDTGRVLHRILEQLPDGTFRTGGDANAVPDSAFVHVEDIEGAAVLAVPWVGRPSLWLAQGRYVLLGGAAVVLLVILRPGAAVLRPGVRPVGLRPRINPAEVLLGRSTGSPADRRASAGRRLLPETCTPPCWSGSTRRPPPPSAAPRTLLEGLS